MADAVGQDGIPSARKKILVVDDDRAVLERRRLRRALRRHAPLEQLLARIAALIP